jgi:hypothetical protein
LFFRLKLNAGQFGNTHQNNFFIKNKTFSMNKPLFVCL